MALRSVNWGLCPVVKMVDEGRLEWLDAQWSKPQLSNPLLVWRVEKHPTPIHKDPNQIIQTNTTSKITLVS